MLAVIATAVVASAAVRLRRTSLLYAACWAVPVPVAAAAAVDRPGGMSSYLALASMCVAVVAGLGAKRPGVAAWNAVVGVLAAVLIVPVGRAALLGLPFAVEVHYRVLLTVLVGTGVVNYLPTRFGVAAAVAGFGSLPWVVRVWGGEVRPFFDAFALFVELTPLIAAVCTWWPDRGPAFDRTWRWFRDRWGVVWALRVREQFNAAAKHRGWAVTLTWAGLSRETADGPTDRDLEALLAAVLRRFAAPTQMSR